VAGRWHAVGAGGESNVGAIVDQERRAGFVQIARSDRASASKSCADRPGWRSCTPTEPARHTARAAFD